MNILPPNFVEVIKFRERNYSNEETNTHVYSYTLTKKYINLDNIYSLTPIELEEYEFSAYPVPHKTVTKTHKVWCAESVGTNNFEHIQFEGEKI